MRWIALVSLLAGCDYLFNLDHVEPRDPNSIDANVGMVLDAGPCVDGALYGKYGPGGAGLLQICVPDVHVGTVELTTNLDTNTDCDAVPEIDSISTQVCVRYGTNVQISNGVQTRGDRPLVIVATDTLTVSGIIDLASRHAGTPGAGSNWIGCNTVNGGSGDGGDGAPGGSFGTRGGHGGEGGAGVSRPSRLAAPPDRVRGGCAGGTGGAGSLSSAGGHGGNGGGAIYLIAGNSIQLDATVTINASGGGGEPGQATAGTGGGGGGGGGGGSGGLVGFDAPSVAFDPAVRILANGGGGAGGGGTVSASGTAGADASAAMLASPAAGGFGGGNGGNGGAGAVRDVDATPGDAGKSGGGGGGATGYIIIASPSPIACTLCSPTAIAAPP